MQTTLTTLLESNQVVLLDGAMGTILFEKGLQHGDSPELWNVERPDAIRSIHRAYIESGAQIILTNTFGCNRIRLALHKLSERTAELNLAAAKLARAEADAFPHPVLVVGSIGPTGSILTPYGDMEYEEAVGVFKEQAAALAAGGVDVLWIETMSDLGEVRACVEACRATAPDIPVVATMTFDTHGRTMMGVTPEKALEALSELDLIALGGNCGNGTGEIEAVIEKMRAAHPELTLVAKSNAGIPRLEKGVAVYDATPEMMAAHAQAVHALGATLIGGCCGSTPDHIRAMAQALGKGVGRVTRLFIACGALAREVIALRDRHGWDAQVLALPALLHNTPQRIPDAVMSKIESQRANYARILIIYGDCGTGGLLDKRLDELGVERVKGPHCYEMYAGETAFNNIMAEEPGTFFLTDYLAQSFDHLVIEGLGLDRYPELRDTYFGNYQRMIYLQQRQDPELLAKARQAAEALQLPLELRQTGYGALEHRLVKFMDESI